MDFDIGVVGLGAMGSASVHALAEREAYYEHPLYVPLVRRAYERWAELEAEAGAPMMVQTGGLMVGPENGPLVRGALESARTHGISHELLDAPAIARRFPAYRPRSSWVGLFEHRAGMLFPERCVSAFISGARNRDAILQLGERVRDWRSNGKRIAVRTDRGAHSVERLVVAAGPWLPNLAGSLGRTLPVEIERQLSHWFVPRSDDERYRATSCPVGLWETTDDGEVFATLPDEGHGVKCGMHHAGSFTTPESVDRTVSDAENDRARAILEGVMPGAGGKLLDSRVCLYTNTPDRHFIIDWLDDRVLLVSPCSGHGFKFASAIGEIVAQLTLDGRTWLDLSPFSLSRFT
jgi:sarcosine oxidase